MGGGPQDSERDPVARETEQFDLVPQEVPRTHAPHLQHADDAPFYLERNARQ